LYHFYQLHHRELKLSSAGCKIFSQYEEDGKILFILAATGIEGTRFIEIGSDDGLNSNCANLALNFGWDGLFIDGNKKSIARGRRFYKQYPSPYGPKPAFKDAIVTRENINGLITEAGYAGEVDLLSIDVDGNDYWLWDALEVVQPKIVIIETFISYGKRNIVVPYDPAYVYPGQHPHYHGASPVAMVLLGKKKGYRLVGANQLGFNFIFLRNDIGADVLPEVSIDEVLTHPSCKRDEEAMDPFVFTLPFVTPLQ
jgi:hypothetical protein